MENGEIKSENLLAIYQIAHDQWAHPEQLRWTVLYNFLVANSILLLGWAAVFATSCSPTRTCSLVVLCAAGLCVCFVWRALGIRASGFVEHHRTKAMELEAALPPNWRLFGATQEYRQRLKGLRAWPATRHTVKYVPLGFFIVYFALLWLSWGGSMWHSLTFKSEISLGDIVAAASFLVAAVGLFLTFFQLRVDSVRKRAEFIISFFNHYITDPETAHIFYMIEYDNFKYPSDFHNTELELHLDRLLFYFEQIAALYHMGVVTRSDLELVRYEFVRVYRNSNVQEYFKTLDKLAPSLGVSGGTFRRYREVAALLNRDETTVKSL